MQSFPASHFGFYLRLFVVFISRVDWRVSDAALCIESRGSTTGWGRVCLSAPYKSSILVSKLVCPCLPRWICLFVGFSLLVCLSVTIVSRREHFNPQALADGFLVPSLINFLAPVAKHLSPDEEIFSGDYDVQTVLTDIFLHSYSIRPSSKAG